MPLTSKKSTSRAPPDQCSPAPAPVHAIATPRVSPDRREPRADLEEPDVAPAVTPVVRDGVDQTRQQRRPQRVELAGERVGDADGRISGRLR